MKHGLMHSFLGLGAAKLLSIPMTLLISVVLARSLGEQAFGQYVFIMALVPLVSLPVSGGLSQLLTREVALYSTTNNWALYRGILRSAHLWVVFGATVIIATYWILRSLFAWVPSGGKWDLLHIALLLIPLGALNAVRKGVIKGMGRPVLSEFPNLVIQPATFLFVVVAILWTGSLNVFTAMWLQVASSAIALCIASIIFLRLQRSSVVLVAPRFQLRDWQLALVPLMIIAAIGTLNAQISIVILGFTSTNDQIAAMRIAERGAMFVGLPLVLANLVIAPHIATLYRSGNRAGLQRLAKRVAAGSLIIAMPVAVVLVVFGTEIVAVVFGNEYSEAAYIPLVVLVAGQLVNVFFGSVGYLLAMTGHERDSLKGQILAVMVNALLCLILAPLFGALGAAVGASIGLLVWNAVLSLFVVKRLGVRSTAV